MRLLSLSTLTLLTLSWRGVAQAEEPPAPVDDSPTALNTVYIEALGPGGLYSLNYERRISDFNIRAGFAYVSNDFYSMTTFPIGFNYIGIGNENAHFEVGGVATVAILDGDALLGDAAGVLVSALAGFRYQPADGGFNFRVGVSPILGTFGALPWGYLSLGGTFGGAQERRAREAQYSEPPAEQRPRDEPSYADSRVAEETGQMSRTDAPTGLGGFEFSMSPDEARAVCQGADHSWAEASKLASCSAPAKSIGLEGDIKMQKCGEEFCQILLTAPLEDSRLVSAVGELKSALERQYGKATVYKSAVPQSCSKTLSECVRDQRAYLEYIWEFSEGQAIKLRLGKRRLPGRPVTGADTNIRLLYSRNPPPKVSLRQGETPVGFGGFQFAMTPEEARKACEDGGHSWTESEKFGACDAPVRDLGLSGEIQMLRCGDEYCQVLFVAEPDDAEIVTDVGELKSALERQYGAPSVSKSAIPQECTQNLIECIDTQRAYIEYVWEFPGGESVKLRLGKKVDAEETPGNVDHKVRVLSVRRAPADATPQPVVDESGL